jgi:hypothetical protein
VHRQAQLAELAKLLGAEVVDEFGPNVTHLVTGVSGMYEHTRIGNMIVWIKVGHVTSAVLDAVCKVFIYCTVSSHTII